MKHIHYPGCDFIGMPVHKAWGLHLRRAMIGWAILTICIYLVAMLVGHLVGMVTS